MSDAAERADRMRRQYLTDRQARDGIGVDAMIAGYRRRAAFLSTYDPDSIAGDETPHDDPTDLTNQPSRQDNPS